MRFFILLLGFPLVAQAPTAWKAVPGANGEVFRIPDMHEALPFGDFPVGSMLRTNLADFPLPSQFTVKTWTAASEGQAMAEIVAIADGGRLAAEVLSGPINKQVWPHKRLAAGWKQIAEETKAAGQSIFTAQERWLQAYWAWWSDRARGIAGSVNVEQPEQVRAHFGDDTALTHWRADLIQRSRAWAKADQAIRRGFPPPPPTMVLSQLEALMTENFQSH